jgi:hypothetical protein
MIRRRRKRATKGKRAFGGVVEFCRMFNSTWVNAFVILNNLQGR